jgi:hypothetical protein
MTVNFNRITATPKALDCESPAGGKDAFDSQYTLKQDDKNPGDCRYTFKRIGDGHCAFEYTMKLKHKPWARCPFCGKLVQYCTCYVRTTPDASSPYPVNTSRLRLIYDRVVREGGEKRSLGLILGFPLLSSRCLSVVF